MKITLDDMSVCFGVNEFDNHFVDLFNQYNWEYEQLTPEQETVEILKQLQFIRNDKQVAGDPSRLKLWDKKWGENLQDFLKTGEPRSLIPKYIKSGQVKRFNRHFIFPKCDYFEFNFFTLLQDFIFRKYFSDYDNIYEFGCGSGINVIVLIEMFPEKKIYGCDFARSSVSIINEISKVFNTNAEGVLFDMSNPSYDFKIAPNSCVLTSGSIEQIPNNFKQFIDYLVYNKVELCCHQEPFVEMFDEDNIVDMTNILFHEKRGYVTGLLPYLSEFENSGDINIKYKKRTMVGSRHVEYNLAVWSMA